MTDFYDYYKSQANPPLTGYKSEVAFQDGAGFGSFLKGLFRWVVPILKENASPIIKAAINKVQTNVSKGFNDFTSDLKDENVNISDSASRRIQESFANIKKSFQNGQGRKMKKIKKKKPSKKNNKKKRYSIFD